jgi:hypothetical protein
VWAYKYTQGTRQVFHRAPRRNLEIVRTARPGRTPPDAPEHTAPSATQWSNCASWHKRYATWHKLCYVIYDLCCVRHTIQHKVCLHEHRRGNTYAGSGNVSAQTPSWEGERTYVRFLGQVKAIGTYLVRTCMYRRLVQRRGRFQYNNVLYSMQASPVRRPTSLRGTKHPASTDSTGQ